MLSSTSAEKKLWEHRWTAAVFAALLLSTLMLGLVIMAGPARAVPQPCDPECPPPPDNSPPTVAADNPSRTVNEGQTALNTGTYSDPDNDPVTLSASSGTVTKNASNGTWSWSFPTTDGPDQNRTVTITASDGTNSTPTTFSLTVNNVAPTVNLQNSWPSVAEGGNPAQYTSYGYNLSVSDPGTDTWTVNTGCGANGSEGTESQFQVWCGFFDGPGSSIVSATATDSDGYISNTATVNVNVTNRNPDAVLNAPTSINEGGTTTISLTKGNFQTQDGEADTNAGFHYAFDCNGGSLATATYANSGTANSTSCFALDKPTITVKGKVMDDDGGSNEYTANVTVNNVFPTGTIQINGGAPATNNATVNLTLSASDPLPGSGVGKMRFRNEDTQTWSDWENYAISRAWQLSSGDGTKTVFVEYKDNATAGNVSQGTISDQIVLNTTDSTAPTVTKWTPTTKKVSPTASVIATFSEAMNEASVEATNASGLPTTFTLKKGSTQVPATVVYSEPTASTFKAVLDPSRKLKAGTTYTATVTSAATDLVGNHLVAKTWKFTVKG